MASKKRSGCFFLFESRIRLRLRILQRQVWIYFFRQTADIRNQSRIMWTFSYCSFIASVNLPTAWKHKPSMCTTVITGAPSLYTHVDIGGSIGWLLGLKPRLVLPEALDLASKLVSVKCSTGDHQTGSSQSSEPLLAWSSWVLSEPSSCLILFCEKRFSVLFLLYNTIILLNSFWQVLVYFNQATGKHDLKVNFYWTMTSNFSLSSGNGLYSLTKKAPWLYSQTLSSIFLQHLRDLKCNFLSLPTGCFCLLIKITK